MIYSETIMHTNTTDRNSNGIIAVFKGHTVVTFKEFVKNLTFTS